jgi:hypothetical protein
VAALQLRQHEQVLHPNPYEEDKFNPVVVTTQRILQRSAPGKKASEFETKNLTYTGKGINRRVMALAVICGLIGAPFLLIGGYTYYTVKDKPTEPPEPVKGKPAPVLKKSQLAEFRQNKQNFVTGIGLGVFGALCCGGAYLLFKRRMQVVAGGKGKIMRFDVKTEAEQDKLMMMIQTSKTTSAATASQPGGGGKGGAVGGGAAAAAAAAAQAAQKPPPVRR